MIYKTINTNVSNIATVLLPTVILINEKAGGSTVNESIDGLCLLSVRSDDLHLNV
jgi:hypothetical protein